MSKKRLATITKAGIVSSLLITPYNNIGNAAEHSGSPVVNWESVSFVPYKKSDGTLLFDPANEPGISPDEVDFVSGYSKGSGEMPSFYVGSDGSHMFFRMRLLESPYDRKGGFLSSVWFVQIAENGVHKATVGINGKSPHEDYIYVSNEKGTVVNKVNSTDGSGNNVPGTRIVEAENGQFFLDFQVPISKVNEVAPSITANSNVQFFFGTSKAANLSVINKDYMGPNDGGSFEDSASVTLSPELSFVIPSVEITSPAGFDTNTLTFTGTTTKAADGSTVEMTINGQTYETTVVNNTWSYTLPEPLNDGSYTLTVKVKNEHNNIATTKQGIQVGNPISIDGGSTIQVSSFPTTISGTFSNENGGSKKIELFIKDEAGNVLHNIRNIQVNSTTQKWSKDVSFSLGKGTYTIEAVEDVKNNAGLPRAAQTVIIDNQIDVSISSPSNNTSSEDPMPTITGSADPHAKVVVFIDEVFYREVTADSTGNWTLEIGKALSPGTHTFKARATDEIGNTKETSSINYTVTSLDISIANGSNVQLNDNIPTIRGRTTAPDGSVVDVQIGTRETMKATVKNGRWSADVLNPLDDGPHTITANVSSGGMTATATQQLTIDSSTFVTITTPENQKVTENKREPIQGTAEPNATIGINLNDGEIVRTAFADGTGNWSFVPSEDLEVGQYDARITASDVNGNVATESTSFSVNAPGNQLPSTQNYTLTTVKNELLSGTVEGTDPDNDPLSFNLGTEAANGTVNVNVDGTWTYTPDTDYTGSDQFTVKVSDGKGGVAYSTVVIEVTEPPNQPPTTVDYEIETLMNTPVSGIISAEDPDGDVLTYRLKTTATKGTATVTSEGNWEYTPNEGYVGPDHFVVEIDDGNGGITTSTVSITIKEPPNQLPEVGNYNESTVKNTPVSGKVSGTDADGDTLTYSMKTSPNHGSVEFQSDGNWTYTPGADYVGPDSFTVEVSDGKASVISEISLNVIEPENKLPIVDNYNVKTEQNQAVDGAVEATDPDGDPLTYTIGEVPAHGTATVNETGNWTYTPATDYIGTDQFTIEVADGNGGTVTSTISVNVTEPINQLPVVDNASVETEQNQAVDGVVEATDPDGDPLTYAIGEVPAHGTATVNESGHWTYTPNDDYIGTDYFSVEVSDGKGGIVTSTISVNVMEPVNQLPVVDNASVETEQNKAVAGLVKASDPNGDPLTYAIGEVPVHGTATVNDSGNWTYTPDADYIGMDQFSVKVSDGKGGTVASTISVNVTEPVNHLPTVSNYSEETEMNQSVGGKVIGNDPDNDALSYRMKEAPTNGTATVNADGSWTYTPATDFTGADQFSVEVSDGRGGTVTSTISINVLEPVNHIPTVDNYNEKTEQNTMVSGRITGADPDGDSLSYMKNSDPSNGTATVDSDGNWSYTPHTDFTGMDQFTVQVSDGRGGTAISTVSINVAKSNQLPVADNYNEQIEQNTSISGKVVATDPDGDSLIYSINRAASHGTAVVKADGTWTYTPNTGYVGTDQFTVKVSDEKGGEVISTISINVLEPVNQLPTVENENVQTEHNQPVEGKVIGHDEDGDTLTYSKESEPAHGTAVLYADGTWSYTPETGYVGTDQFTVKVTDGKGGEAISTISINVLEPVNQLPTVDNYNVKTDHNMPVEGKVIGHDEDGDTLTYSKESEPTHGTAILNADGTWSYTPNTGYVGTDQFTVNVSDGKGGEAISTISINVLEPVNELPVVDNYNIQTELNRSVEGVVKGTDPDGDPIFYKKGSDSVHGMVEVGEDGSWIYTPNTGYIGTDSFTVELSDGRGGLATSTISINVMEPVNQLPAVDNYNVETEQNVAVEGRVMGEDPDGDTVTYTIGTNPAHGKVSLNTDGTWSYTPEFDYIGYDSFTVEVADGKGGVVISTISINVKELVNHAPTVGNYTETTEEDTPLTGKVTGEDPDDDTLTYSMDHPPVHGTVEVKEDGTWTYTPEADYVGVDHFRVLVTDEQGATAVSTVTVEITEMVTNINIDGGDERKTVDRTPLIVGEADAQEFSDVSVQIVDESGNVIEEGKTSLVDGRWSYQVTQVLKPGTFKIVAILKGKNQEKLNRDEQILEIEAAELNLELVSSPATIVGDGKTRAILTAVIKDSNGKPIKGEKVSFSTEAGTLASSESYTNEKGEAIVELISPDMSGTIEGQRKVIKASVSNPDKNLFGESEIVVHFVPASVNGVIMDSNLNEPIPGALIEIEEDFNQDGIIDFSIQTYTDENGAYDIAVPYANWDYTLNVTATSTVEGHTFPIEYSMTAKVGEISGVGEKIKSQKTVSGQLYIFDQVTNLPEGISSFANGAKVKPVVLNDGSGNLKVDVDDSGKYTITGGEAGQTYDILLNVEVTDKNGASHLLVGKKISVKVPEDGVSEVQTTLIDPYGIIIDDETGLPIEGVNVQLYWADTELNRNKGRTPHTLVNLPILEGFAPNDNRVPQFSTAGGAYAWMVFPDGDYYIVAEKDGYVTYDSRTEGRDREAGPGEDSYIREGIIHVGQTIVEYDFSMTAINDSEEPANQAPTIRDYQFKVKQDTVLSEKVTGNDLDGDALTYRLLTLPNNGTITVQPDGSFTYTPLPGFKGNDQFTIEVSDEHGETARSTINIIVEENATDDSTTNFLVETFENRSISGNLKDLNVVNPKDIQVKSPDNGKVDVDLNNLNWVYTPDKDFTGKDRFTILYHDEAGVLYTIYVDVVVHESNVPIGHDPGEDNSNDPAPKVGEDLTELPKTGSLLDRNLLVSLASLLGVSGLLMRRFGRRNEDEETR
ncbi:Ig-like domain-containing protein [Pseudalkalibacillus sp. SCS-8]|uniref:Ig-like domain-containing protein n=1 Tax=Pseudalkalibacillus nanhaiensis TaxID=3115291 RepID=UPI0032DA92B8